MWAGVDSSKGRKGGREEDNRHKIRLAPNPQEPVTRGGKEEEHARHQGHIEVDLKGPLVPR